MYAAAGASAGCTGVARDVVKSCLGLVILVLLRANSNRKVCGKSGSNLTPRYNIIDIFVLHISLSADVFFGCFSKVFSVL